MTHNMSTNSKTQYEGVEKLHLEKEHNELYETALDFENNKPGEVKNPLAGLTKAEIFRNVETYAQKYELNDIADLLKKGALVAQNPGHPEAIEELSARELESIQAEKTHRWRHPKTLYAMVALNSVGAAIQGWDQTGSNGANLSFPQEFGIADTGTVCESIGNCERNSWVVGAINAAPYMALCVIACWLLDPVNHYIGRRGAIFVGAIFSLLAPIGQALAQSWPQILICRILLGIGMGLKEVTVPIFSAENAPASIRGALVMSWQMWVAFGIMLGFSANLAVSGAGDITWRLQLGSACIPAIPLLIGIYLVPESARWLIKKGRHQAAYKSLPRVRNSPVQAARDLYYIHVQFEAEKAYLMERESNFLKRAVELFTVPRLRRATQASGIIMIAQQMCGISIVAFYSSTIFVNAGFSQTVALLVSWGFGMTMFVFAIPALYTVDRWGRRTLLLATFPNMFWTLLATGLSFYITTESKARLALIAIFIFLFVAFYSPGEGPCAFVYSAEAFSLSHREIGSHAGMVCKENSDTFSVIDPEYGSTGTLSGFNFEIFQEHLDSYTCNLAIEGNYEHVEPRQSYESLTGIDGTSFGPKVFHDTSVLDTFRSIVLQYQSVSDIGDHHLAMWYSSPLA
ncbi:hypothetical protein D6C87_07718 [Aureobasidium pullulans]|uniref:Major facilitator superfamily (MFS) profile domain-containing protein n=1 Tax=Aureobasidium pullulans TaxID=5580 RepID=A0AB38LI21_AURPU|nr:hypothetical protein D6C94_10383 [Aureobasidium pullulans]THZ38567.1 hypothetical protein D6C87_07718 [Aureobasidium pullulans]